MDNSKLPSNIIIQKIHHASENKVELNLTAEEVQILSKALEKVRFIPLYTMDQLSEKLRKEATEKEIK